MAQRGSHDINLGAIEGRHDVTPRLGERAPRLVLALLVSVALTIGLTTASVMAGQGGTPPSGGGCSVSAGSGSGGVVCKYMTGNGNIPSSSATSSCSGGGLERQSTI